MGMMQIYVCAEYLNSILTQNWFEKKKSFLRNSKAGRLMTKSKGYT